MANGGTSRQRAIFSRTEWVALAPSLGLTRRQMQVVQLVFAGLHDKAIAVHLGRSRATVRTHLRRAAVRLGADDLVGMVLEVFRRFRASRAGR